MSQEKVTQQEIQDCIKAGHKAGLQNSEQLCVLSIIRRFPQLCLWYADSENENRKLKRELNAAKALAEQNGKLAHDNGIAAMKYRKQRIILQAALEEIATGAYCMKTAYDHIAPNAIKQANQLDEL